MRFKFYLRGCGLGILFTTLILMVGFAKNKPETTLDDKDVIARAEKLGMVFQEEEPEIEEKPSTEQDTSHKDVEVDEKTSEAAQGEEKPVKKPETTSSAEGNDSKTEVDVEQGILVENQPIKVTVRPGEVCRELAEDLFDKGLVSDAEEFRLFMRDSGYASSIRVGEYELMPGMEYLEMAKILTTKQ